MGKLNLFAFLSLLLLCSLSLQAQNQGLDFYLYRSNSVQSIENDLSFKLYPQALISLDVKGSSNWEKRLNFDQEIRNAGLNLNFSLAQKNYLHSLISEYEALYDASELEPSPYENKTASLGYKLDYMPTDSLAVSLFSKGVFRREQDRYISGNDLFSRGYWLGLNARGAMDLAHLQSGISAAAERKKLAWEAFERASFNAYMLLDSDNYAWDNNLNLGFHSEDIYSLIAPQSKAEESYYEKADTQNRRSLMWHSAFQAELGRGMELKLAEDYSQRLTGYRENPIRSSRDYQNLAQAALNIELTPSLTWENSFGYNYAIKDYNDNKNTRNTENRKASTWLAWEYGLSDSLIAAISTELQMLSFPHDAHRWDNDLLTTNYRLGWKQYWHERIKIGAWLGYGERQEVYLDSLLSANNKTVSSYSLTPSCQFLIGDQLSLVQSYQLRADYSDYMYPTSGLANSFYRQVGMKVNLIYDTYPYIARSGDLRWLKLPFRNSPHNSRLIDIGYAYEENQYADDKGSFYEMHTKNRRHTASLSFRYDIRSFYWSITPKYSWGTWTEYDLLAALAWEFDNGSTVEFTLSPYGEKADELDWRSSFALNLRF